MSVATDLASLQRALQRFLVSGTASPEDLVRTTDSLDEGERLGIYASAYRMRLIDALGANYPMLHGHLGQESFTRVALAYLQDHPSTYVSIRDFGDRLSSWLERTRPAEPCLAEFAALEWALGAAFDAKDASPVVIDALAGVQPEEWATLRFAFSPSLRRLTFKTNAGSLYEAAVDGRTPEAPATDASEWLVWRRELRAQYRSLAPYEAIAIDTLIADGTFADACERLAERGDQDSVPLRAASYLKRWLLDEIVVRIRTAP